MVSEAMDNKDELSPARKRSLANLKPAKPGERRNPKGRPPGRTIRQLLRDVAEADKKAVIKKMYAKAKAGDVRAAEWIGKWGDAAALEITTREFTPVLSHPDDVDDD